MTPSRTQGAKSPILTAERADPRRFATSQGKLRDLLVNPLLFSGTCALAFLADDAGECAQRLIHGPCVRECFGYVGVENTTLLPFGVAVGILSANAPREIVLRLHFEFAIDSNRFFIVFPLSFARPPRLMMRIWIAALGVNDNQQPLAV